jgi:hypothetical protein
MADPAKIRAGFGDDPLLSFEFLSPEGRRILRDRYAPSAPNERLSINWTDVPYNRLALVNHIAARKPGARYLEIGCDENQLFCAVPLADKIGVDPVKGGTHRMTSDAFFAQNTSRFDLIFIDGLHTHDQVRRDVINAMQALAPGGWIALHDLVPRSWEEEHVPRVSGAWTGDVWKIALELAETPGVSFRIVMIDHGVGLVRLDGSEIPDLADMRADLSTATFPRFFEAFPNLPKISWPEAIDWIDTVEAQTPGGPP